MTPAAGTRTTVAAERAGPDVSSAPIAVAVPHDGVESALRYAARAALLRGRPLLVVGPATTGRGDAVPGFLRHAAEVAEVLAGPGVPVDIRLTPDERVETALAACRDAHQVVVHRSNELHLLQSLSYGPIGTKALTEVVCVPPGWSPRRDDARPVVVAIGTPFHAADLVKPALEHARIQATSLSVVHGWSLPAHLGPEEDGVLGTLWAAELEKRLRHQVCALHDGVEFEVVVRRGVGADVVLEAAEHAQLLVLGRNTVSADHLCHLGRIARAAVRESPCPVVLLPAPEASIEATA
ncbi:universal stress protein [Nocardioides soli]|uniref:Nucleotide-binding universal stress UspA family protein n=1 Tax=Nocardioides soli TaxID=1036020 RepID=A0A7W4VXT1_9ACTN|nr:universal stress protein [Nocardioides soli]MBB3043747.1 nucleotide-binding universal stress UspA family protein [Nocardioides soli]